MEQKNPHRDAAGVSDLNLAAETRTHSTRQSSALPAEDIDRCAMDAELRMDGIRSLAAGIREFQDAIGSWDIPRGAAERLGNIGELARLIIDQSRVVDALLSQLRDHLNPILSVQGVSRDA